MPPPDDAPSPSAAPPPLVAPPDDAPSPSAAPSPLVAPPVDADPGQVFHLNTGSYAAEVGTRGAALRALARSGRDLVVRQTADLSLLAYSGRVLAPWPNRLRDGTYSWRGETCRVPINEEATNTALHGLLCWTDFTPEEVGEDAVVLGADVDDPGYPSTLRVQVEYRLDSSAGLTVAVTSTNTGTHGAPYGVSHHPYLTAGAAVDECVLTLPAAQVLRVDDRMLPLGLDEVAGELDLRTAAPFGARSLDHAFTGLPTRWEARLVGPDGFTVALEGSDPWCQVYSGEEIGRAGAAVEPMTCPPDAFTTGEGVIVLEPGESHVFSFRIHAPR